MAADVAPRGGAGLNFKHSYGPLPLWGWMGLGLAGALAVANWRKNKTAAAAQTTQPQVDQASTYSTDQTPPYVVINDLYTGTTTTPTTGSTTPVSGDDDDHRRHHHQPPPPPTPTPEPTPTPDPTPVPPVITAPGPVALAPGRGTGITGGFPIYTGGQSFQPAAAAPARTSASTTPIAYRVQPGDSLSKIAAKFGVFNGNGVSLYDYNINSAGRSSADVAVLKQRGPNLIYSGETIYIPR